MNCKFLIKDTNQADIYYCSNQHNPDGAGSPPTQEALNKYCLAQESWKECWIYVRSEDTKMY